MKARKRDVPSSGAIDKTLLDTQKMGREDAIYNGRPNDLTAPPLSIYHSVYANFQREMAESTIKSEELQDTHKLVTDCVAFFIRMKMPKEQK